jgi:hypothetical protein
VLLLAGRPLARFRVIVQAENNKVIIAQNDIDICNYAISC